MVVLNKTEEEVVQRTITFQLQDGTIVHYKEWSRDGIVTDSQIVDKNGNTLDHETDGELIEQIQTKVDEIFEEGFTSVMVITTKIIKISTHQMK